MTIKPLKKYPFKIRSVKVKHKKELDLTWRKIKGDDGPMFEFVAKHIGKKSGRIRNTITILTNSKVKPELTINVGGFLRDPAPPKTNKPGPLNVKQQ